MQHGQGVVLAVLHGGGGQLLGLVVRDLPPDLVPRMSSLVARVYRPRPAMAREPRLDQNRITEELASLHCLKQDTIKLRNDFNLHFTC